MTARTASDLLSVVLRPWTFSRAERRRLLLVRLRANTWTLMRAYRYGA